MFVQKILKTYFLPYSDTRTKTIIGWIFGSIFGGGFSGLLTFYLRRWMGRWFNRFKVLVDAAGPVRKLFMTFFRSS
jgi:hypothetical protein